MSYKTNSLWNEKNELLSFLIFKRLETEKFPRGKQAEYCREMMRRTGLEVGNISAKVSNFKSVAGYNNSSNASTNTRRIFKKYNHLTINELSKIISIQ